MQVEAASSSSPSGLHAQFPSNCRSGVISRTTFLRYAGRTPSSLRKPLTASRTHQSPRDSIVPRTRRRRPSFVPVVLPSAMRVYESQVAAERSVAEEKERRHRRGQSIMSPPEYFLHQGK
ncbi:hypothetical protein K456DRAFT_433336 [Colletotrichum gloeosporioides 23]|nr:hypothetical protein K456DRAFT_433336 [Colletotrichum gloeosporioides 23]